jgi:hypothetical protein
MNYGELYNAIQSYTENQFPATYLANGSTVSSESQINRLIEQAEQRIYNSVQFPSLRKNVTGSTTANNKYLACPNDFLATYSMAVIDSAGVYEYLLNKDVNFIRQAYPQPTDTAQPKYYALFGPTTTNAEPPAITNELSFILGPTPNLSYGVELHYYYYPHSIVKTGVVVDVTASAGAYSYVDGFYEVSPTGGSGSGLTVGIIIQSNTIVGTPVGAGGENYVAGEQVQVPLSPLTGGVDTGTLNITINSTEQDFTNTTWLGDNFDSVLLYGSLVEAYTYMKGEADLISLYNTKYNEALALAKRLGDGMERQDAYRSGQVRIAVT